MRAYNSNSLNPPHVSLSPFIYLFIFYFFTLFVFSSSRLWSCVFYFIYDSKSTDPVKVMCWWWIFFFWFYIFFCLCFFLFVCFFVCVFLWFDAPVCCCLWFFEFVSLTVLCYFVVILGLRCYCEHTKWTEKKSMEKQVKKNLKTKWLEKLMLLLGGSHLL